ncbi:MAG TPA: hypothetical protein VFM36_11950 [Thermoanaerobaculia bacterium]|nr:hypothetical protein [Thermoanaerobaculia bacterium]
MRLIFATLTLVFAACTASVPPPQPAAKPASRPEGMSPSDVMIRPIGSLSCAPGSTAPLNLAVRITNRATESIMIRTIRLTTPDNQRITLEPSESVINGFLEAAQTDIFPVLVTAKAAASARRTDPVSIKAEIEFEARGVRFWETFELTDVPL